MAYLALAQGANEMGDYVDIIVFGLVCFAAATSGGIFAPGDWYKALNKPSWTPPDWLFPIAWTVLYIMIAAAGVLVWRAEGFGLALGIWTSQLILNAAWSWIMFGRKKIGLALADAGGMWLLIVAFILVAWPVNSTASLLFLPYLAWVSVAFMLNLSILRLNPGGAPARA
jgi:benzodiazapine receptor